MYMDAQGLFSDSQELTVSAASTNQVNLQNAVNRVFRPLDVMFMVDVTLESGTSVIFRVQSADDAAFSTNLTDEWISRTVLTAELVAGFQIAARIPQKTRKYLRAYYTIAGTFDAGSVVAGFVETFQTNGADVIVEEDALINP